MALAPAAAMSWTPNTPRPPEAPQTSTLSLGLQAVRLVAEQHAIGGGERQRVAGAFLPGQVLRTHHELAVLHAAELGEGAVGGLVAPDALRGRKHRVAAVAFLVVAVVLVAVDDHFVAHLPALHLGADRPDDAGGVGPRDVIRQLVHVQGRDRLAKRGPDAIVVDAGGHHQHQHVMAVELPGGHDFELHGGFRRAVTVLADHPGVHVFRNMAEGRNFADVVKVLVDRFLFGQRSLLSVKPFFSLASTMLERRAPNPKGIFAALRHSAVGKRALTPGVCRPATMKSGR